MTVALIDGDIFTRRYTAALDYEVFQVATKDGDMEEIRGKRDTNAYLDANPAYTIIDSYKVAEPIEYAKHNINAVIEQIKDVTQCNEDFHIYLGEQGVPTFRHKLYPEYKHKRVGTRRPTHYQAIYDWLREKYDATTSHELEADDIIGIRSGMCNNAIICSNDKDMLTIPGKHYNFITDTKRKVNQQEADVHLFTQVLMGDTTDCIPGLPGVGMAKATAIVAGKNTFQELFDAATLAYKIRYPAEWREQFMLNGNLVYILRREGDSFAKLLERNECGLSI